MSFSLHQHIHINGQLPESIFPLSISFPAFKTLLIAGFLTLDYRMTIRKLTVISNHRHP
jgi:hypothetical protein